MRKVTATATDAIRPLYLPTPMPGGRLVYAQRTAQGFELENARAAVLSATDAANDPQAALVQVTYLAGSACPRMCWRMGEFCLKRAFRWARASTPELFLVYSDGSGVESYRCDHGRARWGGKQLASGDVVFTHGDIAGAVHFAAGA